MQQTESICTIIKEGHIRVIPAKVVRNSSGSLGGVVLEAIVDDGRRRQITRDAGHPTITLAHHEPMPQVS